MSSMGSLHKADISPDVAALFASVSELHGGFAMTVLCIMQLVKLLKLIGKDTLDFLCKQWSRTRGEKRDILPELLSNPNSILTST